MLKVQKVQRELFKTQKHTKVFIPSEESCVCIRGYCGNIQTIVFE